LGLTPAQTFEATRRYAASGGIGARLYDALIGEAAVLHGIPDIVTWNTGHMRGLFPNLDVLTPEAFAAKRAARG
jgi:predicted nucleic acid-binding protein